MHLAVGAANSDSRAAKFTPGSDGFSPALLKLLDPIADGAQIGASIADGAYEIHTDPCDTNQKSPILKTGQSRYIPENPEYWRF